MAEHLEERDYSAMDCYLDNLCVRKIIDGHYSPEELKEKIEDFINQDGGFEISVKRNLNSHFFDLKIVQDGEEWTNSKIADMYDYFWVSGEEENYLERLYK